MKKVFFIIIWIFFIFSTQNTLAKENGLIEDLLNLNYWPMVYDLDGEHLNSYSFKNKKLKKVYSTMSQYDSLIRDEIIYQFQQWTYSYETTNGIIKNYKNFIYYTNQLFYFLNEIEKKPSLKNDFEIQDALLKNYKNSASYYKKVKNLTLQKE